MNNESECNTYYDSLNEYEQIAHDYYGTHDFTDNLVLLEEIVAVPDKVNEDELEALFIDNLDNIGTFLVDNEYGDFNSI